MLLGVYISSCFLTSCVSFQMVCFNNDEVKLSNPPTKGFPKSSVDNKTMSLKGRISSPLEAGTSILDAHHLPPQILPALEYASARLARKAQHLSLVVVRREYQAPTVVSPAGSSPGLYQTSSGSPLTPASSSSTSPKSNYFGSSTVSALRQLVRSGSSSSKLRVDTQHNKNNAASTTTPSSPRMWPKTPKTPMSPPPLTPCTPSSVASMTTATTLTAATSDTTSASRHPNGLRLVHPPGLSAREEKAIKITLHKAAKKFDIRYVVTSLASLYIKYANCPIIGTSGCQHQSALPHAD